MENKLKLYEKIFGDSFPTYAFMSYPESEIVEIIDKCIKANKDVYDIGILSLDEDMIY